MGDGWCAGCWGWILLSGCSRAGGIGWRVSSSSKKSSSSRVILSFFDALAVREVDLVSLGGGGEFGTNIWVSVTSGSSWGGDDGMLLEGAWLWGKG